MTERKGANSNRRVSADVPEKAIAGNPVGTNIDQLNSLLDDLSNMRNRVSHTRARILGSDDIEPRTPPQAVDSLVLVLNGTYVEYASEVIGDIFSELQAIDNILFQ